MTTPTEVTPPAPATPPTPTQQPPATPKAPPAAEASKPAEPPKPAAPKAPMLAVDEPAAKPKSEAPESYKFVAPEGVNYDPVTVSAYEVIARDLGLSQDSAQKMLDRVAPTIANKLTEAVNARLDALHQEVSTHPELGGANLKQTLADAKLTLDKLGNTRLRELLRDPGSGVGSNIGVIEFLAGIARQFLRDDRLLVEASPSGAPTAVVDDDLAARYPKQAARMKAQK